MKFSTTHTFFALALVLLSSSTFPLAMYADNKDEGTGAFRRDNRDINIGKKDDKNSPNNKPPNVKPPDVRVNRPNVNVNRPDYNRPNVNVNRPDYNRPNVNVNRPDYNRPNVNVNRPDYNRPNVNVNRPDYNRPNVNVNRPDYNRPNVNVNRPDYNRPNVNVYRPDYNRPSLNVYDRDYNRSNVNVYLRDYSRPNVNIYDRDYNRRNNTGWSGGGWYGSGYSTPPGWGFLTFATGLVLGAVINSPPPYYSPVVVGSNNYVYSDGVFLQPRGSSYVVIKPPIGAVVPIIPEGCTASDISGVVYYNCSGVIYQPFYQENNVVYRVVSY